MIEAAVLDSLPLLTTPLLTVYLNTNPMERDNRTLNPAYLAKLKTLAKSNGAWVPDEEKDMFQSQVSRVSQYLKEHPLRCRGIVIFAGEASWEFIPLQVSVEDEIHWGAPSLAQLMWLLDENKKYAVVVLGRKRTRFFLYTMGEVRELTSEEFKLEFSKKKEMGPVARRGVRLSRGVNRDVYEHHRSAVYGRYYEQIAERIARWAEAEQLESIFLVGLSRMVRPLRKAIAPALADRVALIEEDLGKFSASWLLRHIQPHVIHHKRSREMAVVQELLQATGNAVLGVGEVLTQLQQGRVHHVVVRKGLDGILQRCSKCSWVDQSGDPVCPSCGGDRIRVELRDVLPELVRRYNVPVEIVSGESAEILRQSGGIGAFLREFERKEVSASAAG
jgi:hypothetical protein